MKASSNPGYESVHKLGLFAASLALGFAVASLQLGLFREAMRYGHTMHYPASYCSTGTAPLNLPVLLWPFVFGQVMTPWCTSIYPEMINWEGFPVVLGASGVFFGTLGAMGVLSGPRTRNVSRVNQIALLTIGSAILLCIVLATLGVMGQLTLPVISRMNFAALYQRYVVICRGRHGWSGSGGDRTD